MLNKHQILFLSHGGGPMPLLNDENHLEMIACLKDIAGTIKKPSAIIVVSAHWEEPVVSITSSSRPELIYDYYGFPKETYEVTYPCPGFPSLAQSIHKTLNTSGIDATLDAKRGFDHGLFVPLKIMFPEGNIPCVQVSITNSLSPEAHLNLGKALHDIDADNLLIIGSGFSFHNMKAFFGPDSVETLALNAAFENWLMDTCTNHTISEAEREERLLKWETAPGARFCHPREEHLLPLHVCYGAARAACSKHYELNILNKKCSMYFWDRD